MTTEQTAIVPSYLDQIELPDDLPEIRLEPGRLNWHHGKDAGKVKVPGVFFGRDTAFAEPPAAPWESDDRFLDDDGPGFSAEQLRMAFIGERSQWFASGKNANDPITWLRDNERPPEGTKIKKQVEHLVLIDGLPDVMVLSVSGYYKSRPLDDIIRTYERGALALEIRRRKRRLPRWTHWLTIGGRVDAQGKPVLIKATDAKGDEHGSDVTPPALLGVEPVDEATFMQAIEAWNLYNSLGWFRYKRLPVGTVEASYTVTEQRALPPGRNVPVPLADDFGSSIRKIRDSIDLSDVPEL